MDRKLPRVRLRLAATAALLAQLGAVSSAAAQPASAPGTAQGAAMNDDEAELATAPRLETVLRLAAARNPGIAEARERARAASDAVPAASRLPDPELKYEQWGVPLARPWALGESQTLMLGVRQSFPAPGSLDARERSAADDARGAEETARGRALDVAAEVERAYFAYYRADRELRLHRDHVQLAGEIVDLTRDHYAAGHATQQDVVRALVAASRLHEDVARLEQELASDRALLNTLMARPIDAPLGPPPDLPPPPPVATDGEPPFAELERELEARRPELAIAAAQADRGAADLASARSAARWPSFMVGADYWYMPLMPDHHAYGAMLSMTLPWLNPARREQVRQAEHALAADRRALEAAGDLARYELRAAVARFDAARKTWELLDREVVPESRQSFEAAQAAFAAGQGDALALLDAFRSYVQAEIDDTDALAALAASRVDIERAVGEPPGGRS